MLEVRSQCEHLDFAADVGVARIAAEDGGPVTYYMASVQIKCAVCGQEFSFEGLPRGLSFREPTAGVFGLQANLPIHPLCEADKQPETLRFKIDAGPGDAAKEAVAGRVNFWKWLVSDAPWIVASGMSGALSALLLGLTQDWVYAVTMALNWAICLFLWRVR